MLPPLTAIEAQVIAMRRSSGGVRVLVGVRSEKCPHCLTGWRTVSTWCTLTGGTERLSWCAHCFNAQSVRSGLTEEERGTFELLCAALDEPARVRFFECARHAVDYFVRLAGGS